MLITEKEKRIINALIEEELNHTINHGDMNDAIIASYSDSLAKILMKISEDAFRVPKNRCFDLVRVDLASRQLV